MGCLAIPWDPGRSVGSCACSCIVKLATAHLAVCWNLAIPSPPPLTQSYLNCDFSCKTKMGIL